MTSLATDWLTAHDGVFKSAAKQHRRHRGTAIRNLGETLKTNAEARVDARVEHARCAEVLAARDNGSGTPCCVVTKERHDLLRAALQHAGESV